MMIGKHRITGIKRIGWKRRRDEGALMRGERERKRRMRRRRRTRVERAKFVSSNHHG